MKNNNKIPATAWSYLITGLLLVTSAPIFIRHFEMPEMVKGLITGMGMMLEVIGIVKIQRSKRDKSKTC